MTPDEIKNKIEQARAKGVPDDVTFKYLNERGLIPKDKIVTTKYSEPQAEGGGLWGTIKGVGNALISSEKGVGETLGQSMAVNSKDFDSMTKSKQDLSDMIFRTQQAIKENKKLGKDTTRLEELLNKVKIQSKDVGNIKDIAPASQKTNLQAAGELGGVALDVLTAGTYGAPATTGKLLKTGEIAVKESAKALSKEGLKQAGKNIIKGAGIGYGYDVVNKLQEGKTGTEALTPGVGTAVGGSIPALGYAAKLTKELTQKGAPRLINSLIKPLGKDFAYGKNPGRAVAGEGITATNLDDLGTKIMERRQAIGAELGDITSKIPTKSPIRYEEALKPIDEAIAKANRAPRTNADLIKRLESAKADLTDVIKLSPKQDIEGAIKIKELIGDITKWTGSASDDKAVNKALKRAYGSTREEIYRVINEADPSKLAQVKKLSERYGDLMSAEVATKYRDVLAQRQNLISMPLKVGGAAGIITAFATGGAAIPAMIAAASVGAIDKALSTPVARTYLAKWLSSESPVLVADTIRKNPQIFKSIRPLLTPNIIKLIEYGSKN